MGVGVIQRKFLETTNSFQKIVDLLKEQKITQQKFEINFQEIQYENNNLCIENTQLEEEKNKLASAADQLKEKLKQLQSDFEEWIQEFNQDIIIDYSETIEFLKKKFNSFENEQQNFLTQLSQEQDQSLEEKRLYFEELREILKIQIPFIEKIEIDFYSEFQQIQTLNEISQFYLNEFIERSIKIKSILANLEEQQQVCFQLQSKQVPLKSNNNLLNKELQFLEQNIYEIVYEMKRINEEVQQVYNYEQQLLIEYQQKQLENQDLNHEELKENFDNLLQDLKKAQDIIDIKNSIIEKSNNEAQILKLQIAKQQETIQNKELQLEKIQRENVNSQSIIKQENEQIQRENHRLQQELHQKKSQLQSKDEQIKQATQLVQITQEQNTKDQNIKNLTVCLEGQSQRFQKDEQLLKQQNLSLKNQMQIQQQTININNNSLKQLKKQIQDKDNQLKVTSETIKSLNNNVNQLIQGLQQTEDAFQQFFDQYFIFIYYECQREPKCVISSNNAFRHSQCGKYAKFYFNARISCESNCPSFSIKDAAFYCRQKLVCSKEQKILGNYDFLIQKGLDRSQFSQQIQVKLQKFLSCLPIYCEYMLKQ